MAGLELLPKGDVDCSDCGSLPHEHEHSPADDHDHDSCSICRMVYEHAVETVEFAIVESDERSFDFIPSVFQVPELETVSGYLTRGPPALDA
ncbi:hypothetical protein MFFC18_07950 [Mariniblastus fucicola]|uniref:Uncharacterized protein n=2 Tax=Mariniblastus fucicola TaxID=980251 RepID=A0A5B9P406_9BACT|nr:hypothetical protein MFFC18_07950 [Mariniblastus fucicola]